MGRLISAGRRSTVRVCTATIAALRNIISEASQTAIESQAYANGLSKGLIIGFSNGTGRIWRFGVCVATPLTAIGMLCKAQSTSSRLQHCDGTRRLSVAEWRDGSAGERSNLGLSQRQS